MTLIPRPNLPSLLSNKHIPFYGDWPNSVANATATRLIRHPNARYSEQEGAPRSVRSENVHFARDTARFAEKIVRRSLFIERVTCRADRLLSDGSAGRGRRRRPAILTCCRSPPCRHVGGVAYLEVSYSSRDPTSSLHSRCHTDCCDDHLSVSEFLIVAVHLL